MRGLLGRPDTKQETSGLGFTRRLKMAVKSKNSVCLSPQQTVRLTFSWISPETPKPEDKRTGMSIQGQSIHSKIPSGLRLNCFQIMHILFLIEIELHHCSTFFIPSALTCPTRLSSHFFFFDYICYICIWHMYVYAKAHTYVWNTTCWIHCVVCVLPADQCALDNWQGGPSWQRLIPAPFPQQSTAICNSLFVGRAQQNSPLHIHIATDITIVQVLFSQLFLE